MKNIALLFVCLVIFGCSKEASLDQDELVFGIYSAFCRSECTNLYLYKDKKIFAQTQKFRFPEDVKYSTTPLAKEKYEAALKVLALMPAEIKNAKENIGCPGCVDEPLIYLGFKEGADQTRVLYVDIQENDLPTSLRSYVKDFLNMMDVLGK